MLRNYRKPLVVAAPKGLLRAPVSPGSAMLLSRVLTRGTQYAASALEEMAPGTSFRSVLVDASSSASPVERIILCAGKHYYALRDERQKRELAARVALVRLEELSPFPFQALQRALSPLVSPQTSLVWAQEEPQNQGAYSFVEVSARRI
jgi:probable 2-oxoglutarate dehydrogenase E1 component DHKTD1